MVNKYETFKKKTTKQPRFDEVYRRNILTSPKIFNITKQDK